MGILHNPMFLPMDHHTIKIHNTMNYADSFHF